MTIRVDDIIELSDGLSDMVVEILSDDRVLLCDNGIVPIADIVRVFDTEQVADMLLDHGPYVGEGL